MGFPTQQQPQPGAGASGSPARPNPFQKKHKPAGPTSSSGGNVQSRLAMALKGLKK